MSQDLVDIGEEDRNLLAPSSAYTASMPNARVGKEYVKKSSHA